MEPSRRRAAEAGSFGTVYVLSQTPEAGPAADPSLWKSVNIPNVVEASVNSYLGRQPRKQTRHGEVAEAKEQGAPRKGGGFGAVGE